MAAADPPLSELIEEEFLKCNICFELYKSPRILPCLHSYCEQCLEKLLEKGKGCICCPECRTETCVQGNIRNIKANFFINGLLDLFESKRNKEAVCSVCVSLKQSPEAVSSRCLDCADFLCRACAEGHCCSKLTLSHTVVSLQDYTAGRYDKEARLRQEQHCHSHQDTLRFYCNTCSIPICRDCRMLEHFSHDILFMADAVKARKPQVEGLISSLDNNIKSIGQQEEAVDSMIGQLKESQSTIQDCVSKYISLLVEQLYAEKDSICKELSDFVQQQEKSYLCIRETLQSHMDSAQSTKDFSRKVMEMGKDYEILQLEGLIQSHIKRLQDINIPAPEGKMPYLVLKEGVNKESIVKQMFQLRFEPHCNSSGNPPTVVATDIKPEPQMTVQTLAEMATFVCSFNTEDTEEEYTTNITGIANFKNGDIVIADESNSVVKKFRHNGKTLGNISVSEECCPCSVTVCGDTVYFSSGTKLYKITEDRDIIQINNFRGSQASYPIASYKGKYIAVSEGTLCTLSLYDPKGLVVDRVRPKDYGIGKFMFLAVNSREEFIVTDTAKKCIVVFTKTGEIINVCTSAGSDQFAPFSVCVDHRDNIYAVESGRIIQLSPKGKYLKEVVNFRFQAFRPKLITCSAFGQLILTNKEGFIKIYKLS
ncbi:E3 ubiquitin-protein ligase TRIM56-like [Polyodon spathula]|uniref:E3 ubiquitin-protein ligase TRIM56-like n=1 Tax=Polyodon spathula TaxID=7913 RepID=UPI001B7ECA01|nr:E3 ubiquitin-protein ligase TRIM56-like [Polyodon spathula]